MTNDSPGKRNLEYEERDRKALKSYLFRFHNPKDGTYDSYYHWYDPQGETDDLPPRDGQYFEKMLYADVDSPSQKRAQDENLLRLYFTAPFGTQVRFTDKWIILPKSKYDEIVQFCGEFGLQLKTELILQIISIAQKIYSDDITFWEMPENQQLISTAKIESQKMIAVLDKYERTLAPIRHGQKTPASLKGITFIFGDSTINLQHSWLITEVMNALRKELGSPSSDWRTELSTYSGSYDEYFAKHQFRYLFVKALYNCFTATGLVPFNSATPYPNKIMRCISRLLEFSLVPVSSTEDTEENKVRIVRNWLQRQALIIDGTQPTQNYTSIYEYEGLNLFSVRTHNSDSGNKLIINRNKIVKNLNPSVPVPALLSSFLCPTIIQ